MLGVVEADLLEERNEIGWVSGWKNCAPRSTVTRLPPVLERQGVAVDPIRPRASKSSTRCVPARKYAAGDAARSRADDGDALAPRGRAGASRSRDTHADRGKALAAPFSAARRVSGALASMHGTR